MYPLPPLSNTLVPNADKAQISWEVGCIRRLPWPPTIIVREWVLLLHGGYALETLALEDGKFSRLCPVLSVRTVLKTIPLTLVFEVVSIAVVSAFLINGVVYKCIPVVTPGVSNLSVALVSNNVSFTLTTISIRLVLVIDLTVLTIPMVLALTGPRGLLTFVVTVTP